MFIIMNVFYRNLPRAMVIGLLIISICYVLVNVSFFSILSYEEIVSTQTVALVSQSVTAHYTH